MIFLYYLALRHERNNMTRNGKVPGTIPRSPLLLVTPATEELFPFLFSGSSWKFPPRAYTLKKSWKEMFFPTRYIPYTIPLWFSFPAFTLSILISDGS